MSARTRSAGERVPIGAWPPDSASGRRRARADIAIGVAVGLLVLAAAPGLALVAVVALLLLAGCLLSMLAGRLRPLRRRRARRPG
jgi:hypothetical protein